MRQKAITIAHGTHTVHSPLFISKFIPELLRESYRYIYLLVVHEVGILGLWVESTVHINSQFLS